jgi:prepilin-type N-terminal cleavage/methylation domain-containing protein/prepilin-type processing-associated H-X9-DG protein
MGNPGPRSGDRGYSPKRKTADRSRAFTLVELLAVIGIIALLVGLLSPSLKTVKGKAKNISCVNNLRQIGIALQAYADENGGKLPSIEPLPSMPMDPAAPLPGLFTALAPQINRSRQVFRCPEDPFRFQAEGSSYEWSGLANGKPIEGIQMGPITIPPATMILCYDFDNVHAGRSGSPKNYLFADGHIAGE